MISLAWRFFSILAILCAFCRSSFCQVDSRGCHFLGVTEFSNYSRQSGEGPGEVILTSPHIHSLIAWDQLIVSWNAELRDSGALKIEARAVYPDRATKFYTLGLWSSNSDLHPRESVPGQKDGDGDVQTDTLVLNRRGADVQIRLTLHGTADGDQSKLKFLGLAFFDSERRPSNLPAAKSAWGKTVPVPERSQMAYAGGKTWCSPAAVSMVLAYWSKALARPDLDRDVPDVARGVYDKNWPGTGNWPFNTAFAGAFPGMRAYVSRFSDVSEIEDWIATGNPVIASVSYRTLQGTSEGADNGHLIVCVGFTSEGDIIVNDPGTRLNVRKTFPRQNFVSAWAHSHNTVYLIYPEDGTVPRDRFGHWYSKASD